MHQLKPLDAQFLGVESARTFSHVGVLGVYDPSTAPGGEVTVERLRATVAERLHLLPPFRWRLVEVPLGLDLPYWVEDPDFDLDYHVRETAIPPPGDDRHVAEVLARIMARPLDRSRPLWELYVVHGLQDGRVGLLTKVHHSVADGVSGKEILTVLLDPTPGGQDVPDAPPAAWGEPVPSAATCCAADWRAPCAGPAARCARLRRVPAGLPGRAWRAPGRAPRGDDPRVGPRRGRGAHLREPDLVHGRADPHGRGGSAAAAAARPRAAAQRQGAPRGAARRPADRRLDVRAAGRAGPRRADDRRRPQPRPTAAEPRHLQHPRAAGAALLRGGAARGRLPAVRRRGRRRAQHHRPLLP